MPLTSPLKSVYIPQGVDLWQMVQVKAAGFEDRTAFREWPTDRTMTFRQVLEEVNTVAGALWNLGVRKGDVVLIVSGSVIETPIITLALAKMGAIMTACNPTYTSGEVEEHIVESGAEYVVTSPEQLAVVHQARTNCQQIKAAITYGDAESGFIAYKELTSYIGEPAPFVAIDPVRDLAFMFFSSGTTGKPKGVMYTHQMAVALALMLLHPSVDLVTRAVEEAFVVFMPLFHIYGAMISLLYIMDGKTNVLMKRFDFEAYLKLNAEHKCPMLLTVPPVATLLAKHPKAASYDLSNVKQLFSGAAPLGIEVERALITKLNLPGIKQAYGLTECISHMCLNTMRKSGSVGVVLPNTECKVVDLTTGEELGPGKEGEILTRGPQRMMGYLNRPDATAETIDKDGWVLTGDIGYYDEDEHFFIVDRKKELIKYKGYQVAPASLEDLLLGHDDVQDTAVIGIADEMAGELPLAFVVLKADKSATEQEIVDYVAERVAPFKKLRGGVKFVDQIPKSASG